MKAEESHIGRWQVKYGLQPSGIITTNTLIKMAQTWQTSKEELAHFLGQCDVESARFTAGSEDTRYSPATLMRLFPSRFPTKESTNGFAYNNEAGANIRYGDRKDLGNRGEASGDGYRYRGRGAIQLTGRKNYIAFSKAMNDIRIEFKPEVVATEYFWETALWFFETNKLWKYCKVVDDPSIFKVSGAINTGSPNKKAYHLAERTEATKKFYNLIKIVGKQHNFDLDTSVPTFQQILKGKL